MEASTAGGTAVWIGHSISLIAESTFRVGMVSTTEQNYRFSPWKLNTRSLHFGSLIQADSHYWEDIYWIIWILWNLLRKCIFLQLISRI